jgi:hypothetical protein
VIVPCQLCPADDICIPILVPGQPGFEPLMLYCKSFRNAARFMGNETPPPLPAAELERAAISMPQQALRKILLTMVRSLMMA